MANPETLAAFEAFKTKEKFTEDRAALYPGAATPEIKKQLTERINSTADDFINASRTDTNDAYQNAIKDGLKRFDDIYMNIDTEDRERVCHYFEELMDIAGVESSEGKLNGFMY